MHSLKYVFALFVIVIAVIWAGALLLTPAFFAGMNATQRYILAIIMIVYAIFRSIRTIKDYKYTKSIENDEDED